MPTQNTLVAPINPPITTLCNVYKSHILLPFSSLGHLRYDTDLVTRDHTVTLRWNVHVVRMCLLSAAHTADTRPHNPSSILQLHSLCSSDHTCTIPRLYIAQRMSKESGDHSIYCMGSSVVCRLSTCCVAASLIDIRH